MWFYAQLAGAPSSERIQIDGLGPGSEWAEAKRRIATQLEIPLPQCRFLHKGKILEDNLGTLHQCRVQGNDVVIVQHLVARRSSISSPLPSPSRSPPLQNQPKSTQDTPEEDDDGVLVADFVCKQCQKQPKTICKECGCGSCGTKDSHTENIVCEECERWYHWQCLEPPLQELPEDSWYCPDCRNPTDEVIKPGQLPSSNRTSSKKFKGGKGIGGMGNIGHPKKCTIVPPNHRGPIPGIEVGQSWKYRACCGGDGVHRPPISGIAGSASNGGAVSIVLSDGYPEDKDCGETFTYTGSGGRDLNGKRAALQSFHQELSRENLALAQTCDAEVNEDGAVARNWRKSLGVRVVRGFKLKKLHPKYAPDDGYRYDGIYKLVKYGPRKGAFGFTVYSYEFRRDDEAPAPWTEEGKLRIRQLGLEMVIPKAMKESKQIAAKRDRAIEKTTDMTLRKRVSLEPPEICSRKRSFNGYESGLTEDDFDDLCVVVSPKRVWRSGMRNKITAIDLTRDCKSDNVEPRICPTKGLTLFNPPKPKLTPRPEIEAPKSKKVVQRRLRFSSPLMDKSPILIQPTTNPNVQHWTLPEELKILLAKAVVANDSRRLRVKELLQKPHPNLRAFVEELERDFECPICKEFVQMPVTSPCGHVACLKCLNSSIDTAFGARCSECRASLVTREPPQCGGGVKLLNPIAEKNLWRKQVKVDRVLVDVVRFCVPEYCKNMDAAEKKIRGNAT